MRLWLLDALKGLALILVMIFHAIFDLEYFAHCSLDCRAWHWKLCARIASILFITISGICFGMSASKTAHYPLNKVAFRSATLLGCALLVSLTTWFIVPEGTVYFGILHFLAIAPLIVYICLSKRAMLLFLAVMCLGGSFLIPLYHVDHSYLVWLGFVPRQFSTVDHFPLMPWLGVYLVGFLCAYKISFDHLNLPRPNFFPIPVLTYMGERTLLLYLAHQPLFIALIYLVLNFRMI